MIQKLLGAHTNAMVVAAARQVINAGLIAVIAALQTAFNDDSSLGSYGWAPVALIVLNLVWGVLDHRDNSRLG